MEENKGKMNGIMSKEELLQNVEYYDNAVDNGDYEKALVFNHLIYNSEYLRYRRLISRKTLLEKEEIALINLVIDNAKSNLEMITSKAEKLKEILLNSEDKGK